MKTNLRQAWVLLGLLLLVLGFAGKGFAQEWPSKSITVVVPYAAGGNADSVARLLAQELSRRMGQPVLVENRAGVNGNVGTAAVARAAPDGYTLLLTPQNPIVNSKLLYKSLPYDPDRDLTPIMKLVESPFAIMAYPAKYPDLQSLIASAKAHPGQLNAAITGSGSSGHLLTLMVEAATGVRFNYVPYKGSGQVVTEIMTGRIDLAVDYPSSYVGQIKSKGVSVLATLGKARSPFLPDAPTMQESGFPPVDGVGWFGLLGPAGLPGALVDRLQRAFSEALHVPEVKARLGELGYTVVPGTPAELRALMTAESNRLEAVIKNANITPQ